jgi:hypothetical protein
MRRRCLLAGGHHGYDGRVVAAEFGGSRHLGLIDGGHGVTLAYPGSNRSMAVVITRLAIWPGFAHQGDLGVRFDQADPVDQQIGIGETGVGQVFLQFGIAPGRKIIGIHLHTHGLFTPAALGDHVSHKIHGVPLQGLDVVLRISDDVGFGQKRGVPGAGHIHVASDPDRGVGIQADHHALGT